MIRILADIPPIDPSRYHRDIDVPKVVTDSVDTVNTVVQQVGDGVSSNGSHNLPLILAGILAALVALGFLIFMVRSYLGATKRTIAI